MRAPEAEIRALLHHHQCNLYGVTGRAGPCPSHTAAMQWFGVIASTGPHRTNTRPQPGLPTTARTLLTMRLPLLAQPRAPALCQRRDHQARALGRAAARFSLVGKRGSTMAARLGGRAAGLGGRAAGLGGSRPPAQVRMSLRRVSSACSISSTTRACRTPSLTQCRFVTPTAVDRCDEELPTQYAKTCALVIF